MTIQIFPSDPLDDLQRVLFSKNEVGVLYDPSNLSTLYQDSEKTLPVTMMEQSVGWMGDLSGNGFHATQPVAAKRPVVSRRVNLMLGSQQWDKFLGNDGASTIAQEFSDLPPLSGVTSVARVTKAGPDRFTWYHYGLNQPLTKGATNTRSFYVKPLLNCLTIRGHTSTVDPFYFSYNLQTKVLEVGSNAGSAQVQELENGWLRFSVTQKVPASTTSSIFAIVADRITTGPAVFLSTGYDSRLATDAHLPYQRVNTPTDYDADPNKFPTYLRCDGVDDAMQSIDNIDLSYTGKVAVVVGIQQAAASGYEMVLETSASVAVNNGTLCLLSPNGSSSVSWAARGVTNGARGVPTTPGSTYVTSSLIDLGANTRAGAITLRLQGVAYPGAGGAGDLLGGGTLGNYPLYLFARNQASLFFNGRFYGLAMRGGMISSPQLALTEHWMSRKMKNAILT